MQRFDDERRPRGEIRQDNSSNNQSLGVSKALGNLLVDGGMAVMFGTAGVGLTSAVESTGYFHAINLQIGNLPQFDLVCAAAGLISGIVGIAVSDYIRN